MSKGKKKIAQCSYWNVYVQKYVCVCVKNISCLCVCRNIFSWYRSCLLFFCTQWVRLLEFFWMKLFILSFSTAIVQQFNFLHVCFPFLCSMCPRLRFELSRRKLKWTSFTIIRYALRFDSIRSNNFATELLITHWIDAILKAAEFVWSILYGIIPFSALMVHFNKCDMNAIKFCYKYVAHICLHFKFPFDCNQYVMNTKSLTIRSLSSSLIF